MFLLLFMIKNGFKSYTRIMDTIYTFCLVWFFGIISVLLDLDHFFVLFQKKIPYTATNLITKAGRPLHIFVIYLIGIICIYFFASVYRLRNSAL